MSNISKINGFLITAESASFAATASFLEAPVFVDNLITVGMPGSIVDYNSIKTAVDSITDATSTNTYTIKVGPGLYNEDPIQLKSFVAVVGESSESTIVQATDPSSSLFLGADQSFISDMKIQGVTAPSASAILYYTSQSVASQAILYVENIRFGANYTHVKNFPVSGGNAAVQCTNVKYGAQPFTLGFHMTSDGTSIGRMLLRNVTTTAGGIQSTTGLTFAKADQPNCTIIANLVGLTKVGSGPAQGIGFWVENGGLLRINTANLQRFDTGIYAPQVGAAPIIDAVGLNFENCTTDVNIIHTGSLGKVAGTDNFSKTIIPYEAPLYEVGKDARRIVVAKKGGDFSSISASVAYITDSSENNRYIIDVGPGEFIEKTIDLRGKPYVSIVGADIQSTHIMPSGSGDFDQFILGNTNEVSFISLMGYNTPGYAAIRCEDLDGFALTHKLSIYDWDYGVKVQGSTSSSLFYGEYIDINGPFSYGVYVSASNGVSTIANMENYYLFPSGAAAAIGNYAVGTGAELDVYTAVFTGDNVSGSQAIKLEDGAILECAGLDVQDWGCGLVVPNSGSAPTFRIVGGMIHDSLISDFDIAKVGTQGRFQGISNHEKINNVSEDFYWNFLDDADGENDITRKLSVTFADGTHTDVTTLLFEGSPMGVMSGGNITISGSFTITTAAGYGYLHNMGTEVFQRIDWADSNLTLSPNTNNYIFIDETQTLTSSPTQPPSAHNIILGRVVTNSTGIELIDNSPYFAAHMSNALSKFNRNALGPVFADGCIVSEDVTPYRLDVTAGLYYFGENEYDPTGGNAITFTRYYQSGSGAFGWNISSQTTVPSSVFNSGSFLVAMSASYFTKHSLYTVGEGPDEEYFLVVGQNQYATLVEAENAGLPTPPTYFSDGVVALASIYVQSGSANITQIQDIRPIIGFRAAGVNASSVHGNLLGLNADDHQQYLLVNGTRAMTGNLDMGGYNISNATFTGSLLGTASYALETPPIFPYTGSINSRLTNTNNIGFQQSESISYGMGSQIVSGNYLALNNTSSVAHTIYSSSLSDLRIGVSAGTSSIPSLAVNIPSQIVGFSLETGSNYTSIFAQRLDLSGLGGGSVNQAGILSIFGGNEQYEVRTDSSNKSLAIRKYNTAGKSIQLVLNSSDTGFNLSNNLTSTSASLFKINNSNSVIVFETFQDNIVRVSGSFIASSTNAPGIDTGQGRLNDSTGQPAVSWNNRWLVDAAGSTTMDWDAGRIYYSSTEAINYATRFLNNTAGTTVVDWEQGQLYDTTPAVSADWYARRLYDSTGTVILDWEAGTFAGSISNAVSASYALTASYALNGGQGAAFPYSGSAVITGSLTVYNSGSTATPLVKVQGGSGELFSIYDTFSGSLFSVNNQSGNPILEVRSDNKIHFGKPGYQGLLTTQETIVTASGQFTVYSIPTASYDGAWFEYVIRSGSNARAGQVMAVWSGTQVNYSETTTTAFGSTAGLSFGVFVVGGNFALTGSATTGGWTMKTIIRSI